MKEIGGLGCALLVFFALIIVIPLGIWGARVFFAEEIGKGNAEIQIQSAENRIVQYDYFFSQCASIQSLEAAIESETHRLNNEQNPQVRSQISANISGLEASRSRAINNYNARASADYTSGQFQASNLPFRLSNDPYIVGGNQTQCAL